MTIFELEQQLKTPTHRFYPTESKYVVYFLLRENVIVYIGKSDTRNYLGRIRSHRKNKAFDCYHVLPLDMNHKETLKFETGLIASIQPEYNKKDCKLDLEAIANAIHIFRNSQKNEGSARSVGYLKNAKWLLWCFTGLIVTLLTTSVFGVKLSWLLFTCWIEDGLFIELFLSIFTLVISAGFLKAAFYFRFPLKWLIGKVIKA